MSRPDPAAGRASMGDVTSADLAPILLVLGDEELLVTRAVTDAVARGPRRDPDDVDVREYQAGALTVGELAEMLSPSLFGGRRVLVLRAGQDARRTWPRRCWPTRRPRPGRATRRGCTPAAPRARRSPTG